MYPLERTTWMKHDLSSSVLSPIDHSTLPTCLRTYHSLVHVPISCVPGIQVPTYLLYRSSSSIITCTYPSSSSSSTRSRYTYLGSFRFFFSILPSFPVPRSHPAPCHIPRSEEARKKKEKNPPRKTKSPKLEETPPFSRDVCLRRWLPRIGNGSVPESLFPEGWIWILNPCPALPCPALPCPPSPPYRLKTKTSQTCHRVVASLSVPMGSLFDFFFSMSYKRASPC
jgi:hypothetical protein